jgi:hypothetical protein
LITVAVTHEEPFQYFMTAEADDSEDKIISKLEGALKTISKDIIT